MAITEKTAAKQSQANSVTEFMQTFEHPLKAEIEAVCALILNADPMIKEGIKWKAPSFCVQEYFATLRLRNTQAVQVILHLGAKVKQTPKVTIDDPRGLLEWLAKDRATVKFTDMQEIKTNGNAFQDIVRQWIAYL
jgi:hypothetical protein